MRRIAILGAAAGLCAALAVAAPPAAWADTPAPGSLAARDSALHMLLRFANGPLPGEVERVASTGVLAWFEDQLARDGRADSALAARERTCEALTLTPEDWARQFVAARRAMREARAAARESGGEDSAMAAGPDPGTVPIGSATARGDHPLRVPEMMEARQLVEQMRGLALLRAVTSEAQLREVMADFWFNHFNVFLNKGADRFLLPAYVEDTIRPHALGKFRDLLIATARSPAMLFYLDNVESVAPLKARAEPGPAPAAPRRRGINENYARELLELHTLGVDGGYTQHDVIEVARILTGWSMRPPDQGGEFMFRPRLHDYGAKTVLGAVFPAGHGEDEGVRLLEMLARHPATVRHVCTRLCARFVSDDPPAGCVDAAIAAWQRSDGDIREVLRAIAQAPEFWSAAARGAKVKTPLEFVVSAARAVEAEPDVRPGLANAAAQLGQPIYLQPSPAGYPERKEEWVNSGALLGRMNFAVALAAGRQPGAAVDLAAVAPAGGDRAALVDAVNTSILAGAMSDNTRRVILREIADLPEAQARALAVGLALGSPEFQKR